MARETEFERTSYKEQRRDECKTGWLVEWLTVAVAAVDLIVINLIRIQMNRIIATQVDLPKEGSKRAQRSASAFGWTHCVR